MAQIVVQSATIKIDNSELIDFIYDLSENSLDYSIRELTQGIIEFRGAVALDEIAENNGSFTISVNLVEN